MTKTGPNVSGLGLLLAAFVGAIFTSAFLLFAVQPMFTKMVLPLLGGSPGVWSVAMVFFQSLLLAGYAYAHLSTKFLSLRLAIAVHVGLFLLTAITLPIGISAGLGDPPASGQELWLIGVFAASVGLPFFAVSANGPLLQAWFAKSAHPTANDPYYLYGASNFGSFAALLLYPVLIEPLLMLKQQTGLWSAGFVVLGALIALAGFLALRSQAAPVVGTRASVVAERPSVRSILLWIVLSAIPSGLLVASTAYLSTDVAASPFLWVIPLAIFLATFIVVFRDPLPFRLDRLESFLPLLAAALALFMFAGEPYLVVSLVLHLAFLTIATLICHARLYRLRPASSHLTTFYLAMSFGGVLGGLFCGLIAPNAFNRVVEYPILIIAALFCLGAVYGASRRQWLTQALPWALGLTLAFGFVALTEPYQTAQFKTYVVAAIVILAIIGMILFRRPLITLTIVAMMFIAIGPVNFNARDELAIRSFFGVNKVQISNDGQYRRLTHGTTLHGAMRIRDDRGQLITGRPEPLSYYYDGGPMSQMVKALPARLGAAGADIAIVGLGTGSLACHGRPVDRWTYFEIDPAVVKIARDPGQFRFLSDCAPDARIVVGDARLTLAKDDRAYDLIVIDAFASDAIPVHLLTKESVAMYMGKLKPGGIVVMHISNRHLELSSVVASIAQSLGLSGIVRFDQVTNEDFLKSGRAGSLVTAVAKDSATLTAFEAKGWRRFQPTKTPVWTDDYSNIVGAMWRAYAK